MKRLRLFTTRHHKTILVSWIQKRCEKCGRFLGKKSRRGKYCGSQKKKSGCSYINGLKLTSQWKKDNRGKVNKREREYKRRNYNPQKRRERYLFEKSLRKK